MTRFEKYWVFIPFPLINTATFLKPCHSSYLLRGKHAVLFCCFGCDAPTAYVMQLLGKRYDLVLLPLCHSYVNKNGWCDG
jgi:hypothetical protein